MSEQQYSLQAIADAIGATLESHGHRQVRGIAHLATAEHDQLSFLSNPKYAKYLAQTKAAAVIISPDQKLNCPVPTLVISDPYLGYAKAAQLFNPQPQPQQGCHPSSQIGEHTQIHETVSMGAGVIVGNAVSIGANTQIHPGVVLGDGVIIGENCIIYPNVTLYHDVNIGNDVILHSGVVVGSDGFGMARDQQGQWVKIPQLGTVVIHDRVEIGANTTIDRGALEDTIIGAGVKLDNQIQVGHNVVIGENTVIAACSGISGSTTIGKNCMISGMVGFTGHFAIADGVVITGMTVVSKAITKPGIYSSGTAIEPHESWRKNAVRFRQLDSMAQRLAKIEKQMTQLVLDGVEQ